MLKYAQYLDSLLECDDPICKQIPVDKYGNGEPVLDEDGNPILTICAFCPAASWKKVKGQSGIFHLGYYCSHESADYIGKEMVYLEGCGGYFKAVAEEERLKKVLEE